MKSRAAKFSFGKEELDGIIDIAAIKADYQAVVDNLKHEYIHSLALRTSTGEKYSQGPVVQSIVSLTSLLVVKILTVLVSTISNSQVFLRKTLIFSAKVLADMPYLMMKVLMIH